MIVEILTERGLSFELITGLKYQNFSAEGPLIDFEARLKRLDDQIRRSTGLTGAERQVLSSLRE